MRRDEAAHRTGETWTSTRAGERASSSTNVRDPTPGVGAGETTQAAAWRGGGVFLDGFSLHAGARIHANDRDGRARLCRFILRPPLALHRGADGDHEQRPSADVAAESHLAEPHPAPDQRLERRCHVRPHDDIHREATTNGQT